MRLPISLFLLHMLFSLLLSTCGNDDDTPFWIPPQDELPPITTSGANTFGCLVNGEVWVNTPALIDDNIDATYNSNWDIFTIGATRTDPTDFGEDLEAIGMTAYLSDTGTYAFHHTSFGVRESPCSYSLLEYNLPFDENNFLKISRFDTDERIVSGEFAFVLVDSLCGDTLRFTEGRFDCLF